MELIMSEYIWPDGKTKIEYGCLDIDNHILYEIKSKKLEKRLNDIQIRNQTTIWVVAYSEDLSQCIYGLSADSERMSFNISKNTIYSVINQMKKNGEVKRI